MPNIPKLWIKISFFPSRIKLAKSWIFCVILLFLSSADSCCRKRANPWLADPLVGLAFQIYMHTHIHMDIYTKIEFPISLARTFFSVSSSGFRIEIPINFNTKLFFLYLQFIQNYKTNQIARFWLFFSFLEGKLIFLMQSKNSAKFLMYSHFLENFNIFSIQKLLSDFIIYPVSCLGRKTFFCSIHSWKTKHTKIMLLGRKKRTNSNFSHTFFEEQPNQ